METVPPEASGDLTLRTVSTARRGALLPGNQLVVDESLLFLRDLHH